MIEDEDDRFDDDPTADLPAVDGLALTLLERHREQAEVANYFLLEQNTLTETDKAYSVLRENGLVEYSDDMIEVGGEHRYTFALTSEGL